MEAWRSGFLGTGSDREGSGKDLTPSGLLMEGRKSKGAMAIAETIIAALPLARGAALREDGARERSRAHQRFAACRAEPAFSSVHDAGVNWWPSYRASYRCEKSTWRSPRRARPLRAPETHGFGLAGCTQRRTEPFLFPKAADGQVERYCALQRTRGLADATIGVREREIQRFGLWLKARPLPQGEVLARRVRRAVGGCCGQQAKEDRRKDIRTSSAVLSSSEAATSAGCPSCAAGANERSTGYACPFEPPAAYQRRDGRLRG